MNNQAIIDKCLESLNASVGTEAGDDILSPIQAIIEGHLKKGQSLEYCDYTNRYYIYERKYLTKDEKEEFKDVLFGFSSIAYSLLEMLDKYQYDYGIDTSIEYPFEESFDEVQNKISSWVVELEAQVDAIELEAKSSKED